MKERDCTLDKLRPGEAARVRALDAQEGIRRRLQDIGLIEGTKVQCLMISPLGDPAAYAICGAVIALRQEDASQVRVEREYWDGGDEKWDCIKVLLPQKARNLSKNIKV